VEVSPHHPLGRSAEFWSSSLAADEFRPAHSCLGRKARGARLPTRGMRQLDLRGGAMVRVSASGMGSNKDVGGRSSSV